jgi:tetratricopeptide (TPR) repeat protein
LNYEICLQLYNNYKKYYQEIYPGTDFKEKDIEFYLSVGGEFVTRAKKELESSKSEVLPDVFNRYIDVAKITFSKVLDLDPNNISALKGLAFAYYNLGAKLIKDMSYDISIEETFQIQENANKYFKQALPYMQKAYELNKDDDKVIEGLTGIYEALHDHDKYIEFKKKLDQIKKNPQK